MTRIGAALLLLVVVLSAGCLGKAPPPAEYLRLSAGECGERAGPAEREGRTVAVRTFVAMPSLDRQAVLVASGPVATASPAWYWEGAPPRVLTEALARRLGCQAGAVVPDRASARPDLLLTGRLERFEVQREPAGGAGPRFELAVRLELWTGDGRMLMSDRRIEAAEGMREVTDRAVAVAAQAALDRFLSEAAAWAGEALRSR